MKLQAVYKACVAHTCLYHRYVYSLPFVQITDDAADDKDDVINRTIFTLWQKWAVTVTVKARTKRQKLTERK